MHRVFVGLLALGLLAGCSDSPREQAGPDPAGSPSSPTDPLNATAPLVVEPDALLFAACEHVEALHPFPAAAFAGLAPDGFTLDTDASGQLIDVTIAWWICDEGGATWQGQRTVLDQPNTMVSTVPVVPPENLRDPDVDRDAVPLFWVTSEEVAYAVLEGFGVPGVEQGDVGRLLQLEGGAAALRIYEATSTVGTTSQDVALAAAASDRGAREERIWFEHEEELRSIRVSTTACATTGTGPTNLGFRGDPLTGPPPVSPGLATVTEGCGIDLQAAP